MIKCTNCGAELPDGSVFCGYCGKKVEIEVADAASKENGANGSSERYAEVSSAVKEVPCTDEKDEILREFSCNMNTQPEPSIKGWNSCVLDFFADRVDIRVMATAGQMTTAYIAGGIVGGVIGGVRESKKIKAKQHLERLPNYVLKYSEIESVTLMSKSLTQIAFIKMKDGKTYNAQIGKVVVQYLQECGSAFIEKERFIDKISK